MVKQRFIMDNQTNFKQIKFKPDDEINTIHLILSREDLLNESISNLWWSSNEMDKMRFSAIIEYKLYIKNNPKDKYITFKDAIAKIYGVKLWEKKFIIDGKLRYNEKNFYRPKLRMLKTETFNDLTTLCNSSNLMSDSYTDVDSDVDTDSININNSQHIYNLNGVEYGSSWEFE